MRLAKALAKRVYWDSCAWIGLVNCEPNKINPLRAIWEAAHRGEFEIWTSAYAYLEVIKGHSEYGTPYPPEESDKIIEEMLSQPYVQRIQLDVPIAKLARKLKRDYHEEGLRKRPDAVHLASALYHNCDEMHTWDKKDLLHLTGKINRRDGRPLIIKIPGPDELGLFAPLADKSEPPPLDIAPKPGD